MFLFPPPARAIVSPPHLLTHGLTNRQGPYIYALYKDEKSLPERTVAMLFAAGFVAAAVSASFAGAYADRFGRRKACLFFCVAYSISCATVLSDSVAVLLCGRLLGGVCTTLLFSVFETWMVHEFHAQGMGDKGLDLGGLCGLMITCSSVVAIVSGVVGELLVGMTQTKTAPFLAAVGCLGVAFVMIRALWVSCSDLLY
jgi:MFS transporter, MFS domain-containing protein family, molybdate-anion transporter